VQQNQTFLAYQYVQAAIAALGAQQLPGTEPAGEERIVKKPPQQGSQQEAIVTGTVTYLRAKNERAPSGEILKALTDQGMEESQNERMRNGGILVSTGRKGRTR